MPSIIRLGVPSDHGGSMVSVTGNNSNAIFGGGDIAGVFTSYTDKYNYSLDITVPATLLSASKKYIATTSSTPGGL